MQLGVIAGARVLATAVDDARAAAARGLGADEVFDPRRDDVVEAVLATTEGRGVDVAIDPVGGDAFHQCRRCLAFEGRLVVVGFAGGQIAELKTNSLVLRVTGVLGVNNGLYFKRCPDVHSAARKHLIDLAAAGRISP